MYFILLKIAQLFSDNPAHRKTERFNKHGLNKSALSKWIFRTKFVNAL